MRKAGGDPDHLPTDWNGLIALAGKVDALGPDVIGMYWETGTDDWMTQNLFRSVNVDVATPAGAVAFDTPAGVAAIDLFRRFHTEGGQEPIDQPAARQQMYAGQMGFYFVSTAAVRSFDREIAGRFRWGTAPVPTAAGGRGGFWGAGCRDSGDRSGGAQGCVGLRALRHEPRGTGRSWCRIPDTCL